MGKEEAEDAGALSEVLHALGSHDWEWFSQLVLAAADHEPMDVRQFRFPVTFVVGRHDSITSSEDVVAMAAFMPDARVVILPGTHFVPLQHPERMLEEVLALVRRGRLTLAGSEDQPDTARGGERNSRPVATESTIAPAS